jgi:hypothetical protein
VISTHYVLLRNTSPTARSGARSPQAVTTAGEYPPFIHRAHHRTNSQCRRPDWNADESSEIACDIFVDTLLGPCWDLGTLHPSGSLECEKLELEGSFDPPPLLAQIVARRMGLVPLTLWRYGGMVRAGLQAKIANGTWHRLRISQPSP